MDARAETDAWTDKLVVWYANPKNECPKKVSRVFCFVKCDHTKAAMCLFTCLFTFIKVHNAADAQHLVKSFNVIDVAGVEWFVY